MNRSGRIAGVVMLLAMVLLAACAPQVAPITAALPAPQTPALQAPGPASVPGAAAEVPSKPAWQAGWERIQIEAKKEGTLVIWGAVPGWRTAFTEAFGKQYGVRVEYVVTGTAAEQGAKMGAERRAGLYTIDVHLAGLPAALGVIKPTGAYDPLDPILLLPEVLDPKAWYSGRLPFIDREHMIFPLMRAVQPMVGVNTNLVKPDEITSYNDLLNPKWKGKIVIMDPTQPGNGAKIGIIADPLMGGSDYLRQLAKNEPFIVKDKRTPVEWVILGKVAFAPMPDPMSVVQFMEIGAPIRIVQPREGGVTTATGGGTVNRVNRWPHPNAGTLFINWLLSKEGLTVASKAAGYPSTRVDVPTDSINPIFIPDPKVRYYDSDTEEYILKQAEDVKKQKEIFGPLMAK